MKDELAMSMAVEKSRKLSTWRHPLHLVIWLTKNIFIKVVGVEVKRQRVQKKEWKVRK